MVLKSEAPCEVKRRTRRSTTRSTGTLYIRGDGKEEEEEEEEEEEAVFIRGVNTNEDSPNAQHAKEVVVVVFTRENRGGSAQHATRATPTRSSHGPMRA